MWDLLKDIKSNSTDLLHMSLWPTQLSTKACKPSCLSSMKFLSKLSLNHRLGGRDKRMFGKLFLNCRHRKVKLYLYMHIPGYKNIKLYNLSTWQDLNGKDGRICFNDSTSYTGTCINLNIIFECIIYLPINQRQKIQ